jgi:hypothetical protein
MPQPIIPQDYTQPLNELGQIGASQRTALITVNTLKPQANEYSSTNPDALADGDNMGRGTGFFLDVYNQAAGTITDITERNSEIVINEYKPNNPYTTPTL